MNEKIIITKICKQDAYYKERKQLIGQIVTVEGFIKDWENGWFSAIVKPQSPIMIDGIPVRKCNLYEFKYKLANSVKKLQNLAKKTAGVMNGTNNMSVYRLVNHKMSKTT